MDDRRGVVARCSDYNMSTVWLGVHMALEASKPCTNLHHCSRINTAAVVENWGRPGSVSSQAHWLMPVSRILVQCLITT